MRVDSARRVLDQSLVERQNMRSKIAELIAAVEQGIQEKNKELEQRTKEVESLRAENEQLQGLLSNLLTTVEAKRSNTDFGSLNSLFGEVTHLAQGSAIGTGAGAKNARLCDSGLQNPTAPKKQEPAFSGISDERIPFDTKGSEAKAEAGRETAFAETTDAGEIASALFESEENSSDWDDEESNWEVESEAEFDALHDLGKKSDEIVLAIPDQDAEKSENSTESSEREDRGFDPEMSLDDILSRVDSIKSA